MEVVLKREGVSCVASYGTSMLDWLSTGGTCSTTRGPHYEAVYVTAAVDASQGRVVLTPSCAADPQSLPLARAAASVSESSRALFGESVSCPLPELARMGVTLPPRHARPRLGSVVLPRVQGNDTATLITKRRPDMRTFPRAWVFPGGAIDKGESPEDAALREVFEETGLTIKPETLRLRGLWESVYPTTAEGCVEAGEVGGHFLVFFYEGVVDGSVQEALKLQESETADAVCVPDASWQGICSGGRVPVLHGQAGAVPPNHLHGIYPNGPDSNAEGIAQGHLFILDVLFNISEACGLGARM